jgi:hypothetical protein
LGLSTPKFIGGNFDFAQAVGFFTECAHNRKGDGVEV